MQGYSLYYTITSASLLLTCLTVQHLGRVLFNSYLTGDELLLRRGSDRVPLDDADDDDDDDDVDLANSR